MWWVNKFGSISGPYTDEQIRKHVQMNRLTRLHKVSEDKVTWVRLDESPFWARTSSGPEEIELPSAVFTRFKGDGLQADPAAEGEMPLKDLCEVAPEVVRKPIERNRRMVYAVIVISLAAVVALAITVGVILFSRSKNGESSADKDEHAEKSSSGSSGDKESTNPPQGGAQKGVSFESVKFRVAIIQSEEGNGTGFFLKFDGKTYLVSNEHVVRSAKTPVAMLVDGSTVSLGAMSIAEDRDLARYEIKDGHDSFVLADDSPNNEDPVWVFGNSSGDGVITTLRGCVTGVGSVWIKTDAEFVPGNSGSPIVDGNGKVIGVAALLKNGSSGRDWTKAGTEFDKVRRLGVRFTGVRWTSVDRSEFEKDCAEMRVFQAYWELLIPYLVCMDVSDEAYKELKLEQKDVDRRRFGEDDHGFHDMLVSLSRALEGQGKSWAGWKSVLQRRDALIKELNIVVSERELTYNNAVKALDKFDRENEIDKKWDKVKARHRDFIAKRKEALLMARSFLAGRKWCDPLMKHGYSTEDRAGSVDWYLEGVQYLLEQNAQKLKDINAALKQIEKGDNDEE